MGETSESAALTNGQNTWFGFLPLLLTHCKTLRKSVSCMPPTYAQLALVTCLTATNAATLVPRQSDLCLILMPTALVGPGPEGLNIWLAVNTVTICFTATCSPNIPHFLGSLREQPSVSKFLCELGMDAGEHCQHNPLLSGLCCRS